MELEEIKESFRKYEHPFDFVIETMTEIRKLKSVYNLSSKRVDKVFIFIKNNEAKFAMLLDSGFDIARLCQVNNLYVNYIDESDELNNLCVRFGENREAAIYFKNVSNSPPAL